MGLPSLLTISTLWCYSFPKCVRLVRLAPAERESEARRRTAEEPQREFSLDRGPIFRARLLRLAPREHWLLLTMHHIVSDAWSAAVLAREVCALYAAFRRGEGSPLPDLPVQYADFAAWQREWLQGEVLERQLAYWRAALANLPDEQAGAGSGIYKMASSLGASFGVAISGAIFTALSADNAPVDWIAGAITFVGRQDNLAIREAALFAFVGNLLMVAVAIISIMLTVPKGKLREEAGK